MYCDWTEYSYFLPSAPCDINLGSTINNKYCYYYCFGARLSFMPIKHKKNKNIIQLYLFTFYHSSFLQVVQCNLSAFYLVFPFKISPVPEYSPDFKIRTLLRVEKCKTSSALCASLYNDLNLLKLLLYPLAKVIFYGKGAT